MKRFVYWSLGALVVTAVSFAIGVLPEFSGDLAPGRYPVPTLTAWGKIFSILLLGALGVAYLVWRRPVVQAQAILETSPLGMSQPAPPLVSWPTYFLAFVLTEVVAMAGVWGWALAGHPIQQIDVLGVLASGAIVAFVIHLLILGHRGDGGRPPS